MGGVGCGLRRVLAWVVDDVSWGGVGFGLGRVGLGDIRFEGDVLSVGWGCGLRRWVLAGALWESAGKLILGTGSGDVGGGSRGINWQGEVHLRFRSRGRLRLKMTLLAGVAALAALAAVEVVVVVVVVGVAGSTVVVALAGTVPIAVAKTWTLDTPAPPSPVERPRVRTTCHIILTSHKHR